LHCINIILYDIRKTSHCTARFIVLLALHCIFIQCRQYDIEYDIVLYTATLFTTLDCATQRGAGVIKKARSAAYTAIEMSTTVEVYQA
jgi:hypothetical protein